MKPAVDLIRSRLPTRQETLPVFAVFVFFGFSWALYRLFWYIPSWLEYLNVSKILTILAYVMAFALIESLLLTAGVVFFSLFFPPHLFKEKFALMGSSLAALLGIAAVLLQRKINLVYRQELWQLIAYPLAFLLLLAVAVLLLGLLFRRFPSLARFTLAVLDRLTIFTYFYVPLSLIGLVVVILRNLIGS